MQLNCINAKITHAGFLEIYKVNGEMVDDLLIELNNISKAFGGVSVLQNVNFTIRRRVVHGLMGGNGAGKSTLIQILSGVYQPDEGQIRIIRLKKGKN